MNTIIVSTDYIYKHEDRNVMIRLGPHGGTSMVEFYVDNRLVYYRPINRSEAEESIDYDLIKYVLSCVHGDRDRWMPGYEADCDWLLFSFDELISTQRVTSYRIHYEPKDVIFYLRVEEHWDGIMKLRLTNSKNTDKISCEFNIDSGLDLMKRSAYSIEVLTALFDVFKDNQTELSKATFNKNITINPGTQFLPSF